MRVEPPITNDTARFQVCAQRQRKVPVLEPGQEQLFRSLWCLDIPIVVEGLHHTMQGSWSPEAIVRTHGAQTVTMFKSGGKASEKLSVARFFREFTKTDADRGYAVKLKDWPPSTSFERDFKQNYNAFMQSVPMPSYARDNGVRNLIAHYAVPPHPFKSLKPDVGPKVYIATPDTPREGSTRLHIDVTCAVNILAWCASEDPNLPAAEWLVFEPKDLEELRRYLRSKQNPDEPPRDPIHSQQIYVTEAMAAELHTRGIRPYQITQRLGDAVFIPAGAAHQVSNVQACIKVACDFLSVEGVVESAKVSADFRREKMPEVLPFETVLWDAWSSLACHAEHMEGRPRSVALTRAQRKNKRQRETPRAQEDYGRRKQLRRASSDTTAMTGYRCPATDCTARHRRFPTLVGVFTHM
ncbi:hypothetical protein OH76DRAFT_1366565 [Lentinus brumalis]|uniref:JmjC domain-containing protein n=1 Tax=Lentinus brumalis TaxID=2498619 RepID=A0A371CIU4_9APHY|nr:hypothetical protein OH76DRAFT_1366565 [Polyporus brumalis]